MFMVIGVGSGINVTPDSAKTGRPPFFHVVYELIEVAEGAMTGSFASRLPYPIGCGGKLPGGGRFLSSGTVQPGPGTSEGKQGRKLSNFKSTRLYV